MIQSDISESIMEIKNYLNKSLDFAIKRIFELFGIILIVLSIYILISLVSYSPEDPNLIFKDISNVNNIMGINGSIISDFLFQSFGLMSFLFSLTILFVGFFAFKNKSLNFVLESLFYTILYISLGSFFLNFFYENSFWLIVNGNGGFVGKYLSNTFLTTIVMINAQIGYYVLVILIALLFFLSTKIKLKNIISFFKSVIKAKIFDKDKNLNKRDITREVEHINEVIENRTQVDLPFNKKLDKNKTSNYILPKINILNKAEHSEKKNIIDNKINAEFLEKILLDFGVEGKIKKINNGPVVTLNEFEPAAGVKVSKIINLSEDIARNTSSESARISTIPGSNTIGIELPNEIRENVYLSEIISNTNFSRKDNKLPISLGKSISGIPIVGDLSTMPHLLIAGTTGSGKSVCINTIILSLIFKHNPDKCKFILIDPKMLELSTYEGIPHLLCPVITEPKKATSVLGWIVKEMENRYKLMTKEGVRNIDGYNSKHKVPMPYIVVIVDEMSDLMLVAGKEIESYIQKLSQMARASGIHIIMATQRPSVDVITGTIKANFPTRISFQVSSKIDSRTILGEQGAEQLLGKGDMLYMSSANRIVRIHAPFVSDQEIDKVNNFIRSQAEPDYVEEILNLSENSNISEKENESGDKDDLYESALKMIKVEGKASTSFLQRKLQIGYNRAARIIDMMEENGEVSKANHVGKREVLK